MYESVQGFDGETAISVESSIKPDIAVLCSALLLQV
jgi:hypothetical protein